MNRRNKSASGRRRNNKSGSGTKSPSDGYKVGYGRPPREFQFKPGQSGHRPGRPKGRKNNATLQREILDQKIAITTEGKIRKVSIREAIVIRLAQSALKGDIKSAAYLLQRDDLSEPGDQKTSRPMTQDDEEIIDAFLKAQLKKTGNGNDKS